jgi:hypothetical protein
MSSAEATNNDLQFRNRSHNYVSLGLYVAWVAVVLAFAWSTTPFLVAPDWMAELARLLFYRKYVF